MADTLRERGGDVRLAGIELTDPRDAKRFMRFPLRHAYPDILGMLLAQLRGVTGEICIPPEAQSGAFDLVCACSPTGWLKTSVPIRSFLKSGEAGRFLDGKPFGAFVVCPRSWSMNLKAEKKLSSRRGGEHVTGTHLSFAGARSGHSLLSSATSARARTASATSA
jgi:hypothetical protein